MTDVKKLIEDRDNGYKDKINTIVGELRSLRPDIEIIEEQYTTRVVYYTVSVIRGEIVTCKRCLDLLPKHTPEKIVKSRFLKKDEAQSAIRAVLPKAKEKFEKCLDAHRKVCNELGFSTGFNYDGDTHGIYDEYYYISFQLDGFDFQFEIRD